jgi:Protein of unknown function (DUF4012)
MADDTTPSPSQPTGVPRAQQGRREYDLRTRRLRSQRVLRYRHTMRYWDEFRQRQWHNRRLGVIVALLLLVALLLPAGLVLASGLQDYSDLKGLGLAGVHHLLAAKDDLLPQAGGAAAGTGCAAPTPTTTPTATATSGSAGLLSSLGNISIPDAQALTAAQGEFAAAERDFQTVRGRLTAPDVALDIAGRFSNVAAELVSAKALANAGYDVAVLGEEWTATALPVMKRLHGSSLANNQELVTPTDVAAVQRAMNDTLRLLSDIQGQLAGVNIASLPLCAAQKAELAKLTGEIPRARDLIVQAQAWVAPAEWLLGVGTSRRFLVQPLDRSELRPTGGFAGEYGVLTIQNGKVASLDLNNVDLLDYGHYSNGWAINNRPPATYSWWPIANWGLRDANLSPDFPTDAKLIMSVFKNEGGGNVDGLINFTPLAIAHVLKVTGPIKVPIYGDTVTADNLEQKIHYYQLDPAGEARNHQLFPHDTQAFARKRFAQLLAQQLESTVRHLPLTQLNVVAEQGLQDIRARDIQVYVNNPQIQGLIARYRATGTILTPRGVDSFFVVQTNWSAAKSTPHIQVQEYDSVWLDNQGGATHYLTLTLTNNANGPPYYGFTTYQDYIRIYAPPQATLLAGDGFDLGTELCDFNPKTKTPCPAVPYIQGELVCPAGHYNPGDRTNTLAGNDKNRPLDQLGLPTETTSDVPGTAMWGGNVVVPIFCTATVWMNWYVPNVAAPSSAVPATSRPYTLIVQRQGGTFYEAIVAIHPAPGVAADGKKVARFDATLATDLAFTPGKQPQPYSA